MRRYAYDELVMDSEQILDEAEKEIFNSTGFTKAQGIYSSEVLQTNILRCRLW